MLTRCLPNVAAVQMLGRIYGILHMQNPELIERKRFKIKPPQVLRVGTTKTCWANFTEICKMCVARCM